MKKVLVFNCHYNGLSIIQELGRHNVPVLALDSVRSIGTYSSYARYHHCPDPHVEEQAFIDYLMRLGANFNDKPVLFPTNDHWAVAVSRHKEKLLKYYVPCVADYPVVKLLVEKQRFYEWALSSNLPVPRSWRNGDADEIPEAAFPLVAKPEYRRVSSNDLEMGRRAKILDRMRLTVLRNREDLENFIARHRELLPYFLFQEYVEGMSDSMYTIGVYADRKHEVMGLFTGRKVRGFPPDVGDCVVGQVESVPPELKTLVKQVCREIKYHGIAEFEFKQDVTTGQFKLIEINPRSWSWIGITPACGVSLPWMAYADLTGVEPVAYTECNLPTGSVKYVKVLQDMENCLYRNRWSGFPDWHMSFFQWLQSLRADRLVCAEFMKDDLRIGVHAIFFFLKSFVWRMMRRG